MFGLSSRLRAGLVWLDQRTGVRAFSTRPRIPARANSWLAFGGLLLFLFGLQATTGALLLFHFVPHPEHAFESVGRIMRDVPFGWLIRLLHVHTASWLVMLVFFHLFRVALTGAYKQPRELVWVTGCSLMLITLAMSLTGYILPWSQLSYWATTVVTSSFAYVPLLGDQLVVLARGGPRVGPATFSRAFAAHVTVLPLLAGAGIALHLALVRHAGLSVPPERSSSAASRSDPAIAIFPAVTLRLAIVIVGFLILLFVGITVAPQFFSPPESFVPANPFETPANAKPEWYFLWSYQLPRLVSERISLLIQSAALCALFALPFLDRSALRHPLDRPFVTAALVTAFAAWVALSIAGALE